MTTSARQRVDSTPNPIRLAAPRMAWRLAQIARDQFWAARRAADRPAMIYWSARENVLRRRAYDRMAIGALPACASAQT